MAKDTEARITAPVEGMESTAAQREREACAKVLTDRAAYFRKRAGESASEGFEDDAKRYRADALTLEEGARSIRARGES